MDYTKYYLGLGMANIFQSIMIFLLVFAFVFFMLFRTLYPRYKQKKQTEEASKTQARQEYAKVVAKSTQRVRAFRWESPMECHVSYEFADGSRKDFVVDMQIYNTIVEGEEGILSFHELNGTNVFVNFQRKI